MASIQQLVYTKPHRLEWREAPRPRVEKARDAIVRPLAVARCDLDLYIASGHYRSPAPFPLGHEIAAVVVETGDAVRHVKPGDPVIVPFQISCGECRSCRRGWTNACQSVPFCAAFGLGTWGEAGGGFADLLRVPFADHMLLPLPDALSPEQACGLSDNVADAWRTLAPHLRRFPGEPVLIAGGLAQSIGLYAVQAALALGAEDVLYVDFEPKRLELARAMGAQVEAVDYGESEKAGEDFLITVDAACTPAGTAYALRSTAPCGFCTSVSGGLGSTTELPLNSIYLRGVTYEVSRVHSRNVLPQVVEKACCGALDPLVFAQTLAFHEAGKALLDAAPKLVFSRTAVARG